MKDSNLLRNEVIYQIFVRQYPNHSFNDVKKDLKRIKALGANIIYLMPIFPIGKLNRKGTYGSPYAIYDYDEIDPFLGTKEELKELIDASHQESLKIIVDLALNHTSCDAKLLSINEEYYYHKDGKVSGKCADWSDVIDLDYDNNSLHEVIIKSVSNLLKLGFDGFRMDVCSLIPMKFWHNLYKELIKINEDLILVGESVHPEFRNYILSLGVKAPSDEELFDVFDCLYQYDIDNELNLLRNNNDIKSYVMAVEKQNNYFKKPKLRYLENHDTNRIAYYIKDKLDILHSLNYFLPGLTFIYRGEEYNISKRPDLFEFDPVDVTNINVDYSKLFKKLADIRKLDYFYLNNFKVVDIKDNIFILKYQNNDKSLYGIFNFSDELNININELKDGKYYDLLTNKEFDINNHNLKLKDMLIFEV